MATQLETFTSNFNSTTTISFDIFEVAPEKINYYALIQDAEATLNSGLTLNSQELSSDQVTRIKAKNKKQPDIVIFPHNKLEIKLIPLPKTAFLVSSKVGSDIQIPTNAKLVLLRQGNKIFFSVAKNESGFIFFNERRVKDAIIHQELKMDDRIYIDGVFIQLTNKGLKVISIIPDIIFNGNTFFIEDKPFLPRDFPLYKRTPRILLQQPEEKIDIKNTEINKKEKSDGLLKVVLPPLGMIAATFVTTILSGRNPVMVLAMGFTSVVTIVVSVLNFFRTKKQASLDLDQSRQSYQDYLLLKAEELSKLKQRQVAFYEHHYPDQNQFKKMADEYSSRIYEKQADNADFLTISLGTTGLNPAYQIDFTPSVENVDDLSTEAANLVDFYKTLDNAPLVTNLKDSVLGIVGSDSNVNQFIKTLLLQIAFFHSYRDVQFVSVLGENDQDKYDYLNLFRHSNLDFANLSGVVIDERTRDIVLTSFYQLLVARRSQVKESNKPVNFDTHYIFTIFDDDLLYGHSINEFLAEDLSKYGVTLIFVKDDLALVPEQTNTTIKLIDSNKALLINDHNQYKNQPFNQYEKLTDENYEDTIRKISSLIHTLVAKNSLPESLTLLEQYEVKTVEELNIADNYKKAQVNKTIASLIGWRGKKDKVYWDLHERAHGPHALVGGTTGSGKSEFLTTYLIGLAINYSPEQIGFLIIDWKGGGIANTLSDLPHFLGAITNLDGAGTTRALISINAELKNRQQAFADFGVNNINGYTKLYLEGKSKDRKEDVEYPEKPIPHLVLVSDEFAELKANAPDFLDELTSVARIGRSLGVHLILATQKPSGVVNDQIESNSTSKIALKMQNEADSKELLKTPDAASIVDPGRGYLKVGNNIVYELFQSGYAGSDYDPDSVITTKIDKRIYKFNDLGQQDLVLDPDDNSDTPSDKKEFPTQLDAVISHIKDVIETMEITPPDKPWLPPLEEHLVTPIIDYKKNYRNDNLQTAIPLGLVDIPTKQQQVEYLYDLLKSGNTLIMSSPGFGKTTLLYTLLLNLSKSNKATQMTFNLLDFSTNGLQPLKSLPNVIDIVSLDEEEKLVKMLELVENELSIRTKLFKKQSVSNLEQYNSKVSLDEKLPINLTVLDGYDLLQDSKYRDRIDSLITSILNTGNNLGLYIVITATRSNSLRMNMLSNIQTKITMYFNDEDESRNIFGRESLVTPPILGRGQLLVNGIPTAIQFYLPVEFTSSNEYLENLNKQVLDISTYYDERYPNTRPNRIPMVPEVLDVDTFVEMDSVIQFRQKSNLPLGLSMETTQVVGIQNGLQPYFLFAYKDEDQQKFLLSTLLNQVSRLKPKVQILDLTDILEEESESLTLNNNFVYLDSSDDGKSTINLLAEYTKSAKEKQVSQNQYLIITDLKAFIDKTFITADDFKLSLKNAYKAGLNVIIFSPNNYISSTYDLASQAIRDSVKFNGFVGTRIYDSALIRASGSSYEEALPINQGYFIENSGSEYQRIKLPLDYEA
ncbi:MAG: type VII secretion protein EssC [Lactobacillaceae bacterium]|jgi:S-DNA-T family DNA segregation ATPase FtsK/SpoIIIE|nr:type VII secretion protein EssC [Lactobacillaceae bacterium]